jgi:hypothetical protein
MNKKFLFDSSLEDGHALIVGVAFFLMIATSFAVGAAGPVLDQKSLAEDVTYSKNSFYASESGVEDVTYRVKNGVQVSATENIAVNGALSTTTLVTNGSTKQIESSGSVNSYSRKNAATLSTGIGVAFSYGLQTGAGGLNLSNSATIEGNVFTNGPLVATNSATIRGTAISAGPAGLINGINVTGSAYAHTILNSTVGINAYYQVISGTTVVGTRFPGSPDQATTSLPVTDAMIDAWETSAATSVYTGACPYIIMGTVTLGNKKIPCDLYISNSARVALTGPVWVTGNIQFSNSSEITTAGSLGTQSVAIIADNPANRSTSSQIYISNSTHFTGGTEGSYIMLVSRNNASEVSGGTSGTPAIQGSNSVEGDVILYAPAGLIQMSNSVRVVEVVGYRFTAANSANVRYESGLQNVLFTAGPSGGYRIQSWGENPQ